MVHQFLSSTPSTLSPVSSHWNHDFDNRRIFYRLPETKDIAIYISGGLVRILKLLFKINLFYSLFEPNIFFFI
jgi:hypothetical protein